MEMGYYLELLSRVPLLYVLGGKDGRTPVPARSIFEWNEWMQAATKDERRVVAANQLDGAHITTVFTGVNRHTREGAPHGIFETFIFYPDPKGVGITGPWRYDTWEEARVNHRVLMVRMGGGRAD